MGPGTHGTTGILAFATEQLQNTGILSTAKAGKGEERILLSRKPKPLNAFSMLCSRLLRFQTSLVAMLFLQRWLGSWYYGFSNFCNMDLEVQG